MTKEMIKRRMVESISKDFVKYNPKSWINKTGNILFYIDGKLQQLKKRKQFDLPISTEEIVPLLKSITEHISPIIIPIWKFIPNDMSDKLLEYNNTIILYTYTGATPYPWSVLMWKKRCETWVPVKFCLSKI